MRHERIVPGTAHLQRYKNGMGGYMGYEHYGRLDVNGYPGCYKVGLDHASNLERLGYLIVKRGTGYCYAYRR